MYDYYCGTHIIGYYFSFKWDYAKNELVWHFSNPGNLFQRLLCVIYWWFFFSFRPIDKIHASISFCVCGHSKNDNNIWPWFRIRSQKWPQSNFKLTNLNKKIPYCEYFIYFTSKFLLSLFHVICTSSPNIHNSLLFVGNLTLNGFWMLCCCCCFFFAFDH